MQLIKKKHKKI